VGAALLPLVGLVSLLLRSHLPDGAIVEAQGGLQVRGKDDAVGAYVLLAVP
jgi:hypothetical protein